MCAAMTQVYAFLDCLVKRISNGGPGRVIDEQNDAESGKARQRRRTRNAIVAATTTLLREGESPSVGEIAAAADVSRRTVYQHFPTLQQLLVDATVGMLSQESVDAAIDAADAGHLRGATGSTQDAIARVTAMIRVLVESAEQTMPLGRNLLSLTVGTPPEPGAPPRRGYRRTAWIERALDPLRPELSEPAYERLVSALAMVVGWEALLVLQDLRGLEQADQVETSQWAARALIEATMAEGARS
jgi:AcrR family transcriptional regulator